MTPTTLYLTYCAGICILALIVWLIAKRRLHRERVNALHRNDKVKVTIEVPATYLCRMDSDTHRIKIDSSIVDVKFKNIKFK